MKLYAEQLLANSRSGGIGFLAVVAIVIGSICAFLAPHPIYPMAIAATVAFAVFALKAIREPLALAAAFLLSIILLPPFYSDALGETPVYLSTLLIPLGLVVILVRFPDFKFRIDPVARGLLVFLLASGLSLPFGWWLSGVQVGNQGFLRWLMLSQAALIYFLIRGGGCERETRLEKHLIPVLIIAAVATAAYGIFDFVWPVPIPHPAADQFIWMRTSIIRRAQGVFYEAGNFGNMCAFFLVLVAAIFVTKREREIRIPNILSLIFTATLSIAVFVSFTRSTWISVLVAAAAFVAVAKDVQWRRLPLLLAALGAPVFLLPFYSQGLWSYLITARLGYLAQLFADPNLASSGRFDTWNAVLSLVASHPQYLLFGIGYKTLPITRLFHNPMITDNGFLNLVLECGVVGLGGFLFFSGAIFLTFFRCARQATGAIAFWGAFLFAFWCGEWTQMAAVDAYTYWRNMAVFLGVMAFAMNRIERTKLQHVQKDRS